MTELTDFDGCGRKCRLARKHTLAWGECEHASKPEPTVSLSKIFKDTDGYPSIGYDSYTVQQLAELIEPALRNAQVRLGPNALAMLQRGEAVGLSGGEYADLAREAAYAIVHRNDPAYTSRLRLEEYQTCDACGAAYKVGVECSTCAFRTRMDAEMTARGQASDRQKVAYRAPGLDVLYCIACRPADDRFVPVDSSDLPDGGICANCDMDVLIQAGQDDAAIIKYAREVGLVEPERAPRIVAAAREFLAEAGIDTPGCDCAHESMGPAWHLKSCSWLATLTVPHPDTVIASKPEAEVRCEGCGHHEGEGCGCPPPARGIRELLEHVGIDTTGKDIRVGDRVVDAWPHSCDHRSMECNLARTRQEHTRHDWEPQPGMTPLHCPGYPKNEGDR